MRSAEDTNVLFLSNLFRLTALELKTLQIPSTMIVDTMVGSLFQHHNIHAVGMLLTLRPHPPALVHDSLLSAVGADRIARNGDTANKVCNTHFTHHYMVLNHTLDRHLQRRGASGASQHPVYRCRTYHNSRPRCCRWLRVCSDFRLGLASCSSRPPSIPIEHRPPLEACIVRGALYPPSLDQQGNKAQAAVMIPPEGLDGIYNPSFDVTPAELITAIVTERGVAVKGSDGKFDLSSVV